MATLVVNPVGLPLRKGARIVRDINHRASEVSKQNTVESKAFPVPPVPSDALDKIPSPHDAKVQGVTHLRDDIQGIGNNLNNVNNELYHVLNELLNGQTTGFEYTLYNMRAKDYNAALPDRKHSIKPLLNPITGEEHAKFFGHDEAGNEVAITIEALERLHNKDKEAILLDLGMGQNFNLLHHMIFGPKGRKADDALIINPVPPTVAVDEFSDPKVRKEAMDAMENVTGDQGIAEWLFDEKDTQSEMIAMYNTYLTTQLRVSVGLPRNYCPHI